MADDGHDQRRRPLFELAAMLIPFRRQRRREVRTQAVQAVADGRRIGERRRV
ncbi:MAG: hypothetical protein U1E43_05025 [Rhodospirillales bacterium]